MSNLEFAKSRFSWALGDITHGCERQNGLT